jgi:integrase
VLSQAQFDRLLSLCSDRTLRDLLIVTWETGCRPQESLRVEARHTDLTNSRWVFPASESKGGLPRVVYLTEVSLEITRRLLLAHPEGKLFRNSRGKPWTTEAVNCGFVRLQSRMGRQAMHEQGLDVEEPDVRQLARQIAQVRLANGRAPQAEFDLQCEARRRLRNKLAVRLAPKYSLYVLRHSWATHALERGVDALTVAILMGHRDPSTLAKVYQHLAQNPQYLLDQAKRAVG